MKFALLGGDERSLILRRLLSEDGHKVSSFALDKNPEPLDTAQRALCGADCAVFPLPAQRGKRLNAPLCEGQYSLEALLPLIPAHTPVCAGNAPELRSRCAALNLPFYDYFEREDFAVLNANLTAEGAVGLILHHSKTALLGKRVLICGFGRIAVLLALKLRALGAIVIVAARSSPQKAWASCIACDVIDTDLKAAADIDFAINTIPQQIFGQAELSMLEGATLLELASPPYGFSQEAAASLGMSLILAPGLPGVCAPESAGEIIRDTIYKIMEESK